MADQEPDTLKTPAEPSASASAPTNANAAAPASATASATAAGLATQDEAAPSQEEQLRRAEQKAGEHLDSWLRAKAETENLRKRAQADIAGAHKYAVENLAEALLPVRDSLEAALATGHVTLESLNSGVELTLKQLNSVFEKINLREINPIDEKFDPHRHQAMTMVPHPGEPNQVVSVMQKGYLLHERVIRPALVTVSKAEDA